MTQLEVIDFHSFPNFDFRAFVKSDSGNHIYYSQMSEFGLLCTCVGFRVYKRCKHSDLLLETIEKQGENIMLDENKFNSSIKAIEKIVGGIPKNTLINFYGEPQSAKSTVGIWSIMDIMRETGQNGLIIDAESGLADSYLPNLTKAYNKLYGTDFGIKHMAIDYMTWKRSQQKSIVDYKILKDDNKERQIIVVDASSKEQLGLLVGKPFEIDLTSKKPQVEYIEGQAFPFVWDSPLFRLINDENSEYSISAILLDSITIHMEEFGTAMQNFPPRHTVQQIILTNLYNIIHTTKVSMGEDVTGIIIAHSSRSPTDAVKDARPVGGKSLGHGFKTILQFDLHQKDDLNTTINMRAYRLPTRTVRNSESITINDKGVF